MSYRDDYRAPAPSGYRPICALAKILDRGRVIRRASAMAIIALAMLTPTLAAQPSVVQPTIGVDEIERGQKGYGLSVFAGSEPQRFEVEIIGVMRDQAPDTSFVLARLSGHNLEQSGVIAGMSGSPVYIDERLVGAVAFSWPFTHEAIAGITPIGAMRRLNDAARGVPATSTGGGQSSTAASAAAVLLADITLARGPVSAASDLLRSLGSEFSLGPEFEAPFAARELLSAETVQKALETRLEQRLSLLSGLAPGDGQTALQWTSAGFSAAAIELLESRLSRLAPAGGGASRGRASSADAGSVTAEVLAPGGAVAAVLVDGDMRLAATGTITDRQGDEVLGFGHPFLGLGSVEIPMATAEILTVMSSRYSSFKLSNVGEIVGSFDLDRSPGIHGKVGAMARTLPLTVELGGPEGGLYRMHLAMIPQLTPALIGTAVLSAVDATTQAAGEGSVEARMTFEFNGHRPLVLDQVFDGAAPTVSAAFLTMTLAGYFLDTDLLMPELESIRLEISEASERRLAKLVGAHASHRSARAGEEIELYLDWVGHRAEPYRSTVSLRLPTTLSAGRYSLIVGDGVTLDTVEQSIAQRVPADFEQAFEFFDRLSSANELRVIGLVAAEGLVFDDSVLPQLPGSMRSIWESSGAASALVPVRLAVVQRETFELDHAVVGGVRLDIQIVESQTVKAEKSSS